VRAAVNEAVR